MKKFITSALLISAFILAMPMPVQGSYEGARARSQQLLRVLENKGWNVRSYYTQGLLQRGGTTTLRFTLYAGNHYQIVVGGCEDCYDVDAGLFDENDNLISKDTDNSSLAVVEVNPKWTGTFYLLVKMYNSTRNGAHYVVQYAYGEN